MSSLLILLSCRPPTVLVEERMIAEDLSGGFELIDIAIIRFQNGDTLQYLFTNNLLVEDYPFVVRNPYVCFTPKDSSGVLGILTAHEYLGEYFTNVLPLSERSDQKDVVDHGIFYLPLYNYKFEESTINFRKMTQEERMTDTRHNSLSIYRKGQIFSWTLGTEPLYLNDERMIDREEVIFHEMYDVLYKYLNGSDTLSRWHTKIFPENGLTGIPMFYLPLDENVYYRKNMRKYLVKKRLGFSPRLREFSYNQIEYYRDEIDTAFLALPVKIFQEKYMQTKDVYCLDGMSFPY